MLRDLFMVLLFSFVGLRGAHAVNQSAYVVDFFGENSKFLHTAEYERDFHTGKIVDGPTGKLEMMINQSHLPIKNLETDYRVANGKQGRVEFYLKSSIYNFQVKLAQLQLNRSSKNERIDYYLNNSADSNFYVRGTTACKLHEVTFPSDLSPVFLIPNAGCSLKSPLIIFREGSAYNAQLIDYIITSNTEISAGDGILVLRERTQPKSSTIVFKYDREPVKVTRITEGSLILDFTKVSLLQEGIVFKNTSQSRGTDFYANTVPFYPFLTTDGKVIVFAADKSTPRVFHKYVSNLSTDAQAALKSSKIYPITNFHVIGSNSNIYAYALANRTGENWSSYGASYAESYALLNHQSEDKQLDFWINAVALYDCIITSAQACDFLEAEKIKVRKNNFLKSILGVEDLLTDNPRLFSIEVSYTSIAFYKKLLGKAVVITKPAPSQPQIKVFTVDLQTDEIELTQVLNDCATEGLISKRNEILKTHPISKYFPNTMVNQEFDWPDTKYFTTCNPFNDKKDCVSQEFFSRKSGERNLELMLKYKLEAKSESEVSVKSCTFDVVPL